MTSDSDGNEVCALCGEAKVAWHGAWLCIICDNPDQGFAEWFENFTSHPPEGY